MKRWITFTFRVNREERKAIASLATQLQRSQSDVVRLVVTEAARQLNQINPESITVAQTDDPQRQHGKLHVEG